MVQLIPSSDEVMGILKRTGAFREGHFVYPSGKHTPHYFQMPLAFRYYDTARVLAVALSRKLRLEKDVSSALPRVSIISPSPGGIPVAFAVREALNAEQIYWAEREEGKRRFRQYVNAGEVHPCVIVDDISRTGKALHSKTTMISVQFKPAPRYAFPFEAGETWRPNRLTISIQPQMDIRLRFQAKQPGPHMVLLPVDMIFSYAEAYGDDQPEAYETLLEDVIEGNPTLFMRADQVEAAWRIIQPILDVWKTRQPVDFPNYAPGSWGPEDAEALIAKDGHHWATLPEEKKESAKLTENIH